jgi:hypothetical protein
MVRRIENWPLLLSAFLRARRDVPFQWGENDCVMFAADAVRAITGVDYAAGWRGTYSTEEQAADLLKSGGGIDSIITDALGIKGTRNLLLGRRGDVVTCKTSFGRVAGIIDDTGQRIAVPMTDEKTLVRLPLNMGWRVWSY